MVAPTFKQIADRLYEIADELRFKLYTVDQDDGAALEEISRLAAQADEVALSVRFISRRPGNK